jgi:hypothetical protein
MVNIHRHESWMPSEYDFLQVFDISKPREIFKAAEFGHYLWHFRGQFSDFAANEQSVYLVGHAFEVMRSLGVCPVAARWRFSLKSFSKSSANVHGIAFEIGFCLPHGSFWASAITTLVAMPRNALAINLQMTFFRWFMRNCASLQRATSLSLPLARLCRQRLWFTRHG